MRLDLHAQLATLAELGFKPLPTAPGQKHPLVRWTDYRNRSTYPALASEFRPGRGIWTILGGVTGWAVLDTDNQAALDYWLERIPNLWETAHVKTRQGWHFYFRIPVGVAFPSWSVHSDAGGPKYDVIGDEKGVMMPPSVHPDDPSVVYEWVVGPEKALEAPECLRGQGKAPGGAIEQAQTRSMLVHLLSNPPVGPNSGRDNWLAQVGGHLAKWVPHPDAYLALMRTINHILTDPLTADEVDKKIGIWRKEQAKPDEVEFKAEAGWLIGTGTTLLTEFKRGEGKEAVYEPGIWADFDLRVRGVIDDQDDAGRTYVVDIATRAGVNRQGLMLTKAQYGSPKDLTGWLAGFGATIMPEGQGRDVSSGSPEARRLLRYLNSQDAPAYLAVDHLGWHDGYGFVTHDGVLTPAGLRPHSGICPVPGLRNRAEFRYGWVPAEEAIGVLREVMTFQFPATAAVFGAWWAMSILKGQFSASQFPFMALEASSESGKTTGFFASMLALAGNGRGPGEGTKAAVRQGVSAHRNGIYWIDDMTDTAGIQDLLRQATVEGSRSKMAADNTNVESVRLLSPVLISGEGMGTAMSQKAIRDRVVRLEVASPKDRRSIHNPDRPQWDDVLALLDRYGGDLTRVAGTVVAAVLARAHMLEDLPGLREAAGRHQDTLAVLRMGARVLDDVMGTEWVTLEVERWCGTQVDEGAINLAIREIIPWVLRNEYMVTAQDHPAAFVEDGVVWVSPARLADKWSERRGNSERDLQLGTAVAIADELRANGVQGKGTLKQVAGFGRQGREMRRYHALTPSLSALVLSAAGRV